jgi:hypothetical protein
MMKAPGNSFGARLTDTDVPAPEQIKRMSPEEVESLKRKLFDNLFKIRWPMAPDPVEDRRGTLADK